MSRNIVLDDVEGYSLMYKSEKAPFIEVPESLAVEMVIRSYTGELCIFCNKPITREDMDTAKWAPWSKGRACHGSEWNLKKYQALLEIDYAYREKSEQ